MCVTYFCIIYLILLNVKKNTIAIKPPLHNVLFLLTYFLRHFMSEGSQSVTAKESFSLGSSTIPTYSVMTGTGCVTLLLAGNDCDSDDYLLTCHQSGHPSLLKCELVRCTDSVYVLLLILEMQE